jgi:hypothetical protein
MRLTEKERKFLISWTKDNPDAFNSFNPMAEMSKEDLDKLLALADRQPDDKETLERYADFLKYEGYEIHTENKLK